MGYQPSSNSYGNTVGRRDCVNGLVGAAAGICLGFLPPQKAQAVISKEICASGQGSGCDDLAEGNEYIKSLQQKSASNADMYARVRAHTQSIINDWGGMTISLHPSHSLHLYY